MHLYKRLIPRTAPDRLPPGRRRAAPSRPRGAGLCAWARSLWGDKAVSPAAAVGPSRSDRTPLREGGEGPLRGSGREASVPWRTRLQRRARAPQAGAAGFTLIEVLVVLVILVALASIVTMQLLPSAEGAKADSTKVQIKALGAALDLYRLQNSSYPTTDQGLDALLHKPQVGVIPDTWRGPYLNSGNLPLDGWKRPFLYQSDGQTYVITSLGADGVEGGTGLNADIRSTDL